MKKFTIKIFNYQQAVLKKYTTNRQTQTSQLNEMHWIVLDNYNQPHSKRK